MVSPTLRRRRLSRLLRELREEKGLTAGTVAAEAKKRSGRARGWSASKLTRLEGAEWKRVRADDVLVLLDIYEVTDEEQRAAYATLAREANQQGWWASFGDVLGSGQFVGLESEASRIRTFESVTIPGLLQTPEYARALISASGQVTDEHELGQRVDARMFRKSVFSRARPLTYWAVIDELALMRITPDLVGQLDYLLEMGTRPNVGIQILPAGRGPHAAMTGQFVLLDFPAPDQPVVYLECLSEEIYLEKDEEISRYQHLYDYVQAEALSVSDSRDLIERRRAAL
ncbi:helix-turn-helix domain-containing protein [Nocardiopsis suaedae]|uniref:Helix-turn-helix transcriptional regulator n=1 Tax=Nocardiopsis suaedae TaxID=3018444 RepID=A0ABT4TN62_9ACTN|nr:helix-turn-helix transcriptional regulator [Nocardiopsis suaedae]MDA2805684.1 helix-turn-helix transcriptional regulator [Nocardiopsis suaedae]